ncbi:cytidylyltransferase domain-containing protein [Treponema sp. C6A8]|uniref:cytidylyltransferase domain-containing protein n=1 Tax=Treponema sp. C6A8 TaxID=1410609 RepID=UPI00056F16E4|nr:methyltransferase domain-containing protein [Treponema sp. C6A8]
MKTNRVVIVQCRLSSTRLPQKALKMLGGKPVLAWVLQSMRKVNADRYFVATDFDSYDSIKPICEQNNFECFKGDLNDVLKRFCDLLRTIDCKTVIRATADNPFLFYEAAEESVKDFEYRNQSGMKCDYLTWTGLPHGSGVEIFNADSLLKAEGPTSEPYDHEHVGPALYNHKETFKCEFIKAPNRFYFPKLRTTIDTPSDFLRACQIVNSLKSQGPFSTEEIVHAACSDLVKFPVVLVPSVTKGHGTGHLHRCLSAASKNHYFVYIPHDKTLEETDSLVNQYKAQGLQDFQIIDFLPDETYCPVIVTDSFELTQAQLEGIKTNRALISIDEGSDFTSYCDYLLDIIPSYNLDREANLIESDFMEKPQNKREGLAGNLVKKVLVSLGGEDPSGLTTSAAISAAKYFSDAKITAIISGEKSASPDTEGVNNLEIIKPVPNLKEQLFQYDLVITHYGLTAFEAMSAGCAVILLPTTRLHKNLAQKYNFAYVADSKISEKSIEDAWKSKNIYPKFQNTDIKEKNLGEFLKVLSRGEHYNCPVCQKAPAIPDKVISRNISRTYRRCQTCGMLYMSFSSDGQSDYSKSYFFEDYKKQYGKTYQEDFDSIKEQGKRRLSVINMLFLGNLKEKNCFDIGCAYGPFMQAASEHGLNTFGTDISVDAVQYVQRELKFPATVSQFPQIEIAEEFGISQFDIVTMWYVIEHFNNLDFVLKKVSEITKKGGIFAFSTPSGEGVSIKTDSGAFFKNSPADHFTIWEPSRAAKILKKYGFEVVKVVSTGHHPERFAKIKKSGAKPGSLLWRLTDFKSRKLKLGDTFEIYCRKK